MIMQTFYNSLKSPFSVCTLCTEGFNVPHKNLCKLHVGHGGVPKVGIMN